MESARLGLATLCAHAARGAGAERVFWCPDSGEAPVAGPRAIAPREVEWRWIEERRSAGQGVTRRGHGRLRRALRDGVSAELWLVRGERAAGARAGVLGLEFAHGAPRHTEEVDLGRLWELALLLEERAGLDVAASHERAHAARGRHAARLVHDLRHELTLARLIASSGDASPGAAASAASELVRVLDGAAELCAQALAAPEDLAPPRPVVAAHALRRAVEDVRRARAHARTLVIEVDAAPDLVVMAERTALARILANALSNAVEATPRGGRVRLVARAVDGGVDLAVEDEGRGLDRRRLASLARGDGPRQGLHGHGFESAHEAAAALGSELRVASRAGVGTRVGLRLSSPSGRETILLVDPLLERRDALAAALERAGWGSVGCSDPGAALRALASGPLAVAIARGTAPSGAAGLGALLRRARALGLPCLVLGSALEGGDARQGAAALTARLSDVGAGAGR